MVAIFGWSVVFHLCSGVSVKVFVIMPYSPFLICLSSSGMADFRVIPVASGIGVSFSLCISIFFHFLF